MTISYPFKRQQRLLKPADYKQVFDDKPYKSADRYLTVLARPNGQLNARLGLVIAKKRVKLAVIRNRLKRLIRESFRQHQYELAGLDCVVLAREGVGLVSNPLIIHSLTRHWQQLIQRCKKS